MDTDDFIAETMRRVAASAEPPAQVAPPTRQARRWRSPVAVLGAAAAVAVVVGVGVVIGSQRPEDGPAARAPATSTALLSCRLDHRAAPLPRWARAGFTPPDQPVPHVVGDRGDIVAVLWAEHHPLVAPPASDRSNKVLWVARVGAAEGPLEIRATLPSTGQTVVRTVAGAPGPSTIDLPAPGCWSIDLAWGEQRDHVVLGYASD